MLVSGLHLNLAGSQTSRNICLQMQTPDWSGWSAFFSRRRLKANSHGRPASVRCKTKQQTETLLLLLSPSLLLKVGLARPRAGWPAAVVNQPVAVGRKRFDLWPSDLGWLAFKLNQLEWCHLDRQHCALRRCFASKAGFRAPKRHWRVSLPSGHAACPWRRIA